MNHFYLAGVTAGATQINQITEQELDPQIQEIVEGFDGQVDASFAAVMKMRPRMNFSSSALALVLTTVGIGGISSASTFYFQPAVQGGTRDPTNCVKMACNGGLMCLGRIDAQDGQPATASLMNYIVSADGTTNPMTITIGETLPTPVATRQVFTTGPVKINGTLISGVKSSTVDFGLNVTVDEDSGAAFPTLAYIGERRAKVTVRTTNVDLVQSLGLFAAQSGTSKSVVFFRKMLAGGTRVPDATAQHVSLTMSAGIIVARRIGGSNGQPQMAEIDIPVIYDGTNAVVAVSTAAAVA